MSIFDIGVFYNEIVEKKNIKRSMKDDKKN